MQPGSNADGAAAAPVDEKPLLRKRRAWVTDVIFGHKRWLQQDYLLDRMTLPDLVRAYFTYPAIQVYILLFFALSTTTVWLAEAPLPIAAAVIVSLVAYPLVEYLLHRFLLHARWMYKSPLTAALWKRVHYDHHQDPNDLSVLFGGLSNTLPIIVLITLPLGWSIGALPGATAAFATGCAIFCFYEFCHCIQHLSYKPRSRYLQRIRKRHLGHHFHSEQGNFGITSSIWDHLFGSFYRKPSDRPRSPTARNLGYDEAEERRYPWVAQLSGRRPQGDDDAATEHRGTA